MPALSRAIGVLYLLSASVFGALIRHFDWERIERVLAAGPQCPLRRWTGWKCAFCGMTHSWIALAKGDWSRAFAENALGPVAFAFSAVLAGRMIFRRERRPWPRETAGAALLILATYAVTRNLV